MLEYEIQRGQKTAPIELWRDINHRASGSFSLRGREVHRGAEGMLDLLTMSRIHGHPVPFRVSREALALATDLHELNARLLNTDV